MVYKQIPKGYFRTEFPLPHNMSGRVSLNTDDAADNNCTYIPIILNDEGLVNADTVNVNPEHGSFAESNTPYCYKNSIIPKINFTLRAKLNKGGIETDKLRSIILDWMPIYTSFLNRLEAQDSKTAVQVEDILELQHETVGKSCYPIYDAVNMTNGSTIGIHANATTALMGMTTTAALENVAFNKELFYDALQYYTNAPMLKKVIGKMHRVTLYRDHTYTYHSNNFTNPMVKRINDYTFCGILLYAPLAGTHEQLNVAGDTTDIAHINLAWHLRYDEWNPEFDQTTS